MMWLGTLTLATCFFVSPRQPSEGLPATDPHAFLNFTESCVCCHETDSEDGAVEAHAFTVDIIESCMRCHDAEMLGTSHKVGVEPDRRYPDMEVHEELPLDEDERITCGTCHNPHLPGFSPERYAPRQRPAGTREEDRQVVVYYKTFYLRRHLPDAGNDPTCAGCHTEMI